MSQHSLTRNNDMAKFSHTSAATQRQDTDRAGADAHDAITAPPSTHAAAVHERLRAVNRMLAALAPAADPAEVARIAGAQLDTLLGGNGGFLLTFPQGNDTLAQRAPFGAPLDESLATALIDLAQHAIAGANALTALHPRHQVRDAGQYAMVAIPLRAASGIVGALLVAARDTDWPAEQWELLLALADAIAPHIGRVVATNHDLAVAAAITDQALLAMFVVDTRSRAVIYANAAAAALSGYPRDTLEQGMIDQVVSVVTSAPDGEFEGIILAHDGTQIPAIISTAMVTIAERELQLLTVHDLALYRQQFFNKVKSESLAGLQRLTAAIAHEINNPLQAIANSLHLLLHRPLNDDKRMQYLSMAHQEVEQLTAIVRRMLDVHRPSLDGMRPIALHVILDSVLELHAAQLERQQVTLRREWGAEPSHVMGVAIDLRQVFSTLVRRALAAMPEGGELLVRTRAEPALRRGAHRMVLIEFVDSGDEITPAELGTIFEPFARTSGDATGMGLPICYSIVMQHEGRFNANSGDEGSVFAIWLPAVNEEEAPVSAIDQQPPAGA
jgi:signal transduction histidine kinase